MEITLETNKRRLMPRNKGVQIDSEGFFFTLCAPLKKKIQIILERHFHRAKWIRMRYFELASVFNILLASNQTADSAQKMEKMKKTMKQAEKILFQYKMRVYRKAKKRIKEVDDLRNLSEAHMIITLLVKHELESAAEAFRRREKLQTYLRGAARTLLNGNLFSMKRQEEEL
jgi:hypothetical protein